MEGKRGLASEGENHGFSYIATVSCMERRAGQMAECGEKAAVVRRGTGSYDHAMRMRYRDVAAWMLVASIVFGTTAAIAAARTAKHQALPIVIRFVPPATCEISVAGQLYSLPSDQDRMAIALRQLRRKWKSVQIFGGAEIPYRCAGHAVFIAQSSGFKKVGFVAEPPE